jgi:DNA-binding transcriptional ArsR family regulator
LNIQQEADIAPVTRPMHDQHVIGSFEELKAVSDPLRSRILAVLSRGAMTTLQVARELGEKPTRLYHHVDILERAGLIRLVREQPKRGTVERYFEPVARVFVIDRDLLNASDDAAGPSEADTTQALVDGVLRQTMDELRQRISRGDLPLHGPGRMRMARLLVRGSEQRIAQVMRAVEALIDEASRLPEDVPPTGETAPEYRLQLVFYPLGNAGPDAGDVPPSPSQGS